MTVRVPRQGSRGTDFPRFLGRTSRIVAWLFRRGIGRSIAGLPTLVLAPGWLHNLAHDPDATIELAGGDRIPVRAETLEGPELEAAWRRIGTESAQYADYRTKTDREIAVIRLRRRQDA